MTKYPKEFLDLLESVKAKRPTNSNTAYIKVWIYYVRRTKK